MKAFERYVNEWEKNAEKDPYWSVLTSSQYETTGWDKESFFNSGKQEVYLLKEYLQKVHIPMRWDGTVLDFGCGTGRLSQALGDFFSEVYGIDISAHMIQEAKDALTQTSSHIKYIHNPHPNLELFESEKFDFIYSNIVLQHIAKRHQLQYLKEFARLIKVGGWLIFQTPSKRVFPSFGRKMKGKIIELLPFSLKKQILVHLFKNESRALKDFDFEINVCSERTIKRVAIENKLEIKHISYTNSCEPDFCGNLTFKSYEQAKDTVGYLSPMYFMQRHQ